MESIHPCVYPSNAFYACVHGWIDSQVDHPCMQEREMDRFHPCIHHSYNAREISIIHQSKSS
jgi:hypothetical protein